MISELEELQESDETLWESSLSFEFDTRSTDGSELVHKCYTFSYAPEWDKWVFREYEEKRTPDASSISDRDWRRARHIFWSDQEEAEQIDVPPEVSKQLAQVTGSDSITVQVPSGTISEQSYEEFTYETTEK